MVVTPEGVRAIHSPNGIETERRVADGQLGTELLICARSSADLVTGHPVAAAKSSTKSGATNTLTAMLSDEDRIILEFERCWWLEPGPKDQAIEFTLGMSAAAYYERLIAVVGLAESSLVDPLTVARIKAMIQPSPAEEKAVS